MVSINYEKKLTQRSYRRAASIQINERFVVYLLAAREIPMRFHREL